MKLKIEIKNRFTGDIIFQLETENNSIKKTLTEAVKRGADLQDADLRRAYLQGADLRGADLRDADLRDADLRGAYLRGAYLQGAYLQDADLRDADLRDADLRDADLRDADLQDADLRGAYLRGAYLKGAYLRGVKIKTAIVFTGLYTYIVIPYITESNEHRVKMGCYDRSVDEWDKDFWNNDNEFPNDNSLKSNERLLAYETAKKWLLLNQQL